MICPIAIRRRLSIALVTETWPPEINGVAMTLNRLVRGLAERQHRIQVVRPRQPHETEVIAGRIHERIEEVLRPGVAIPRYQGLRLGAPSGSMLRRLWTQRRPDVVHVATEGPLGFSALGAARALGIPLSSSFHTNFHDYSRHYALGFLRRPVMDYLRRFHNRTRFTMVPSDDLIAQLENEGFRNCVRLSRGIDTALFSPDHRDQELRRSWGVGPGGLVVLCVGRVAPEKDLPLAIEAFRRISPVCGDARLVVVGDGPLRERLERENPGVVFTGTVDDGALARHYASADLFLFPSQSETYGNVLMEAMASGLPCVGFDYAAARQHGEDGVNARLVPLGDREAFIAAVESLAVDRLAQARLGRAARTTAEAIAWDPVVSRFAELLDAAAEDGF